MKRIGALLLTSELLVAAAARRVWPYIVLPPGGVPAGASWTLPRTTGVS